jgi:NADPH-dependent 2,4-dienoyl-CoA reductase/sulfur reductase-like enzyme
MAPSPIPMDRTRDVPHALEVEEIASIVAGFAAAARRARAGGLDGVELSFAHGNLMTQFLSPLSNHREDEYGGSEQNRLRFSRELLEATRAAVGDDYTLGIRLSADELVDGGFTLEDVLRIVPSLVAWGRLDFVNVSAGTNADMGSRSVHYPTIYSPNRPLVHFAAAIKEIVDLPVFCVGKIANPREAEYIVANRLADVVCMTRAHIADPAIVRKAREGRLEDIRTCIYCNETCFARSERGVPISCVYNPRSGREVEEPEVKPADRPRRVLVVGGGPAGLEAARGAAERGHRVELHERSERLGGQVPLLAATPEREPYLRITEWLERQVRQLGVQVVTNSELDADGVLARDPEVVVLATGARDTKPDVEGADLPHVFTARQVLAGARLGRRVVVGDWDGRHMGTSIADLLAERGHQVEIVSSTFYVGQDIELLTWRPVYERLLAAGVAMAPMQRIVRIEPDAVVACHTVSGAERRIAADSVVLCTRGTAANELFRALSGKVPELRQVGDCFAPRQLEQAILEGYRVAQAL